MSAKGPCHSFPCHWHNTKMAISFGRAWPLCSSEAVVQQKLRRGELQITHRLQNSCYIIIFLTIILSKIQIYLGRLRTMK